MKLGGDGWGAMPAMGWLRVLLTVVGTAIILGVGCSSPNVSSSSPTLPNPSATPLMAVVTTNSIIGDLVRNVGGDRVDTRVLLSPGVDPHSYQPTPADMQKLVGAKAVFRNGLGLDAWVDKMLESHGGETTIVTVSEGIPLRSGENRMHSDDHETATTPEEHVDHGGEYDPHVWLNAGNALIMAGNVARALSEADPTWAEVYGANLARYETQLKELDGWIVQEVSKIPVERRKLVTNHEALGYFADRYGFKAVGTVIQGSQADREPSARELADLIDRVKAEGVPAVFIDNTMNPKLAETVAQGAGIEVVSSLYTGSLGPADSPASSYIGMMRHNVEAIVGALK